MNAAHLLEAIAFAADKHRRQRRKDAEASPYINHVVCVSTVLAVEGDIDDEATLLAAILHDTVEDTQTTFSELEEHFGPEVTGLVRELTDDKSQEGRAEAASGRTRARLFPSRQADKKSPTKSATSATSRSARQPTGRLSVVAST